MVSVPPPGGADLARAEAAQEVKGGILGTRVPRLPARAPGGQKGGFRMRKGSPFPGKSESKKRKFLFFSRVSLRSPCRLPRLVRVLTERLYARALSG